MKEANIFEAWAERLVEGTWQLPDTPEKQAQLLELMSQDLPVGADATNVTEQLYDLLGDDELFDQLEQLAERDANADARQVIYDRMQMLSDHPDVLKVIEQIQIDPAAEMNPPEATNPADLEPMNESRLMDAAGETIEHILNRFKHEVKKFEQQGELDDDLYHALFDYWNDAGEIPYGTQKARDGDPYEWVAQNLQSHLSGGGIVGGNPDEDYGIERESIEHGDYAEEKNAMRRLAGMAPKETDEGLVGTVLGSVAGAALAPLIPGSSIIGGAIGNKIGDAISSDEEAVDEADIPTFSGEIGAGAGQGPTFNGQIGAGAGQGPIFRTDASTGQHVDVSKVVPGEWGSVGNPGYKTAPGTPTFKDMGTATPANPTALPKSTSGSGGSGADLPKGMLGGSRTPVNEKDSPLAGQYGHSGKMKEVGKDTSFLDRLKELSGLNK